MKKIMEQVLNKLTDLKAEGDLLLDTSKSLKMSVHNQELSEYKVSSSQVLGLRLIKDDKVGIAYTESLDEESLDLMLKQAFENASTNSSKPEEKILEHSGELIDVATYSEAPVDLRHKTEQVLALEKEMKVRDARVKVLPYNGYVENEFQSYFASSRGRYTQYRDQSYQIWTSALMEENDKKSTYHHFDLSHKFQDLNWKHITDVSLEHASAILREKNIPSGKYEVRFSQDLLSSLLGIFSGLFSAKAALDKVNPWAEKIGSQVMSSDLTITDVPDFERAFRKSLFDSEGVSRKALTLVQDGKLETFYHNSITATRMGVKTTAHASRGPQSSMVISGTIMIIQGKNPKAMPDKYLEVFQLDGLHAGTNSITGDFSLGVKGYVWEKGEKKECFGGVTLSGNFFEMLKNLDVVGTELLVSTDRNFFSSPMVFHDLFIAGS
jgi:PmbA protein